MACAQTEDVDITVEENKPKYEVVAAIDFGTTSCGYGYSYDTDKNNVNLNKNWGNTQGFLTYKSPSSILLDAKENFVAFGYEAEERYINEDYDYEDGAVRGARSGQLYRNFKMMLHTKKEITTESEVYSENLTRIPAIKLFTFALEYLKNHMIAAISKELEKPINENKIRWVITVPAIWREESKQFMREAAFRAGCILTKNSKQLIIALEPEAASFYYRNLDVPKFDNAKDYSCFFGTRYLVLDCGGGTYDIVIHDVIRDNKVREIHQAVGDAFGGNTVNEQFIHLLKSLLKPHPKPKSDKEGSKSTKDGDKSAKDGSKSENGSKSSKHGDKSAKDGDKYDEDGSKSDMNGDKSAKNGDKSDMDGDEYRFYDFIKSFQLEEPVQWAEFMSKFERSKKMIRNDGECKLRIDLPYSFSYKHDLSKKRKEPGLFYKLNDQENGVSYTGGKLVLTHKVVKGLFMTTVEPIVKGVYDVFTKVQGIQYIVMVGGFSECEFLQQRMKEVFEKSECKDEGFEEDIIKCRVVVPNGAQLAIIKGAVLFGHYQDHVQSRIARLTYGTSCEKPFDLKIHDKNKMYIGPEGEKMCRDIFHPFVQKGEEVKLYSFVQASYGLGEKQTEFKIGIFSLNRKPKSPVEYIDSPDMDKIGEITLETPDTELGNARVVILQMTFGNTEILAEAIGKTTGKQVETKLQFL